MRDQPCKQKVKRNDQLCMRCRIDKKSCIRDPNAWEEAGTRCQRCEEFDKPCGPAVRLSRNKRRSRASHSETASTIDHWKARIDGW